MAGVWITLFWVMNVLVQGHTHSEISRTSQDPEQTPSTEIFARPEGIKTLQQGLPAIPNDMPNRGRHENGQMKDSDTRTRELSSPQFVDHVGRQDPCPLQCDCRRTSKGSRDSLTIICEKANFTQIPRFPQYSSSILIKASSVYHIQGNAFDALSALITLRIESRVPWTLSENAFDHFKTLSTLYLLGSSPDAKPFPPRLFKCLTTLSTFIVRNLPIDVTNDILCPLRSTTRLDLNNNGLTNLKFGKCFIHFERLTYLAISNNPLTNIKKTDFDNLINSHIAVLNIVNCKLKTLEADLFGLFPSITEISFSNNQLQELINSKISTNVSMLDIKENLFPQLPCDTLSKMPKLVNLISSHNMHMNVTLCNTWKTHGSLIELRLEDTPIDFVTDEFFKVLETSKIKALTLSARRISPKAFRYLKYLESLKFTHYLTLQSLTEGLTSLSWTNISALEIQSSKALPFLPNDTFNALEHTKLKRLKMNSCRIREVSRGTFIVLRSLTELNLHNNKISYLPDGVFEGLFSLRTIDLSRNNILSWGEGAIPWGIEPNTEWIYLAWNSIKTISSRLFTRSMNLSGLTLAHNQIKTIAADAFEGTRLTVLSLENNAISKLKRGVFDHCRRLQSLDLASNSLQFGESRLYNPFEKLTMVKYLRISYATFPSQYHIIKHLFQNLNNLSFLLLSNSGITRLPMTMFENTTNLESLILTGNSIVSWNPELFQPLEKLSVLKLAKNKITNINKASFMYLPSLQRLDLSSNALVCNCDLLWFRSWLTNVYIYLDHIQEPGMYVCAAPDIEKGTELLFFNLSEDDCMDKTMLKLSISLSVSAVFVACLSLLAYRYRFHLYYVFFYVRYRHRRHLETEDNTNYTYDAFIAYNADDGAWVINELLPELEYNRGYKLCLHHRDWLAGIDIVDNILTSIESSRKVILVLSNKFATSHWCQVEATMSHTRMLEGGRNPLILVLLEDIKSRNMTSTLRYLMTSQTYLPWPNEERDQEVFWRRLAVAMKGPRGRRGILYRAAQEEEDEGEDDTA